MRASAILFWVIASFFALMCVVYVLWGLAYYYGRIEWAGTVALGLTAVLGALIAFYLGRTHSAQGGEVPEDLPNANIDDGDPEIGNFAAWSWWPLVLGASCGLMMLGLAVGIWILYIGAALTFVAVIGWVFEFYRGYHAR